ncbi:MAG: hypothetical protein CL677_08050 [Bdellovibrionaceae bacterium]|nr:hypothetical protein [Pseudobdellovibrionaceae bacterium]|tara:strand:+ start:131226 stop:132206 length:981 start_codon:yes stop_codon:yes gene_type:complete
MSENKLFAIGDVHGCFDQLKELISKLPLDDSSTLVFLGDYVDRGPNSNEVIQFIIDLKKKYNVVALRGNHEQMMIDYVDNPSSVNAGLFILNGGSATLASYAQEDGQYDIPNQHIVFLRNLPLYYETEDFFFVHAGVPEISLSEINEEEHADQLLWIREPFLTTTMNWEKTIVHGHTVFDNVVVGENRISLDTGCVYSGALSAMEFPSKKVYQVPVHDYIEYIYLRDPDPDSSRRAHRFSGNVPVTLHHSAGDRVFTCLNYNEFGFLLREEGSPTLKAHQEITGFFGGQKVAEPIEFAGRIVRAYQNNGETLYGVEFTVPIRSLNR